MPRHLHYATIPVHKNAALLHPEPGSEQPRWPTILFSHGLGGNRNTYSHFAGSLASHGVIVVCPEHRDGSAAVSLIRVPENQDAFFYRNTRRTVPYTSLPHVPSRETWAARDRQLRIRLWELGLSFEALLAIDGGDEKVARANMNKSTPQTAISQFAGLLDVQQPGRTIFAGHSFGAASVVQLLKSTYYAERPEVSSMDKPLFAPTKDCGVRKQITNRSPIMLLDMWCLPLLSATPLCYLPLPMYDDAPSAPGGAALLAVESEHFYQWTEHLHAKARIISPDPSSRVVSTTAFERHKPDFPRPHFFHVDSSAHLGQSDFGILFPWLTKRVFKAEQPERCLRLNLRAQLQFLRSNGYAVAGTWKGDLVDDVAAEKQNSCEAAADGESSDRIHDDKAIFEHQAEGVVDAWGWVDIVGYGAEAGPNELERLAGVRSSSEERRADEGERQMEGTMEPALATENTPGAAETAEKTAERAQSVGRAGVTN